MSAEEWRPIPGYPNYEASSLGRIRSHAGRRPRLLTPSLVDRYLMINLGEGRRFRLHTVVAMTFLGPRPDGMVTRHLNDDPLDNRAANLAYGTQADNMRDARANGRTGPKTHCKRKHEFTPDNTYVSPSTGVRYCRACVNSRYAERKARSAA